MFTCGIYKKDVRTEIYNFITHFIDAVSFRISVHNDTLLYTIIYLCYLRWCNYLRIFLLLLLLLVKKNMFVCV